MVMDSCGKSRAVSHISVDGRVQTVDEHCKNVSRQAYEFAKPIHMPGIGCACGLMHDIGKYSASFQNRILHNGPKVDHASAGAQEIAKLPAGGVRKLIAEEVIASHHSGLLDIGSKRFAQAGDGTLYGRLAKELNDYSDYQRDISMPVLPADTFLVPNPDYQWLTVSFMTRMLFSCLVDADYLDTESFMNPGRRNVSYDTIPVLYNRLMAWLDAKGWRSHHKGLAGARSDILNTCIRMGNEARGLYTLTVPTGGGKTVSSLAFALRQAVKHHMNRVIYVVPYCSIIDQTASVFSEILGSRNVLAHYSEAEFDDSEESHGKQLAAENWDFPIIVTTAVQFFESMYSCKPSKCRKLHNTANSIIIFDEAQTMPVPYINACAAAIASLVMDCQSTCVLCTATQPALSTKFAKFAPSLQAEELCPDTDKMRNIFRRVNYLDIGRKSDKELAELLQGHNQVLCIVSTVKHAYNLYRMLKSDGVYCLTTNMLPIDRMQILTIAKQRLAGGKRCILIATSLIEAGVDIDFPAVYRGYAGIDSMIQSGGRGNREGKRSLNKSFAYLFQEEDQYRLPNDLLRPKQIAMGFLSQDITDQNVIHDYFTELYKSSECDKKNIISLLNKENMEFRTASERFHLIENDGWTLYVPIDESSTALIEKLQKTPELLTRNDYRMLGKYTLHLYGSRIKEIKFGIYVLDENSRQAVLADLSLYSHECGLDYSSSTGSAIIV